jgi:endonuclease/exonuclease/phosphatase (EEP) superfamily protein YafD
MLAVTLALMLAALLFQAPKINAAGPILRVVTINTWTDRRRADRIIHFIEQSDADIVLLQEIGETDRAETLPQLQTAYPYIFVDERARNGPAILSRRPWSVSGIVDGSTDRPVAVWARFELNGRTFTVASVHPAYPFLPDKQAEDVDRLIAFVRAQVGPIVLGGDFNLTPFSWQLAKLVRLTGLKWAQTFSVSWPANRLLPIVLLDHVLTREPLGVVQTHTAKAIGSDHLPIVTDLSFWR